MSTSATSATSKIENIYWPGYVLIPHTFDMHTKSFRQVSQITYYGPFGPKYIYIDYDEECDDIYIRADKKYSVDAGNVLNIRHDGEDLFLYDITIREILQHLIGEVDMCVTWVENGLPDSVLDERVFQAPLSKIDAYCNPCIPEEMDYSVDDEYDDLDKAFNYGFEQGYINGVSAGKYATDCDCEFPSYCAICDDKPLGQNEIDKAFSYFEITYGNHDPNDAMIRAFFPHFLDYDGGCCASCDKMHESAYNSDY